MIDPDFDRVPAGLDHEARRLWSKSIRTGEAAMCHSLANIEHHHFKFEAHRRPGDVHVHFFGADAFSFGEGVRLQDGDWMQVSFEGFGKPLRNSVRTVTGELGVRKGATVCGTSMKRVAAGHCCE